MSAARIRNFALVGVAVPAAVAALGVACGGGGSSSTPSTPTSPTSPTPTTTSIVVYTSQDKAVVYWSDDPARANESEPWFMVNHVGWAYQIRDDSTVRSIGWGLAFKFDVQSQIAGREITRATFRLDTLWVRNDLTVAPQIRVSAFASDWDSGYLNWNIWAGLSYHTIGEAQAPAPSTTVPLDFDVTQIVRNWAAGAWGNYGLRAMVDDSYPGRPSDGITSFQSLGSNNSQGERPRLIITLK